MIQQAAAQMMGGAHVVALRKGVSFVDVGGSPGPLSVFGRQAFVVGTGLKGKDIRMPLVAGSIYGKGRVVAFGHTGFISAGGMSKGDAGTLMINAVKWTGNKKAGAVGLYKKADSLNGYLTGKGVSCRSVSGVAFNGISVLVVPSHGLKDQEVEAIRNFVKDGGGLITAGLGWGWKQLNRGKDLPSDHPGNKLLVPMGIAFADGSLNRDSGKGFDFSRAPGAYESAYFCLVAAQRQAKQPVIKRSDLKQVSQILMAAMDALPQGERSFLPTLRRLAQSQGKRAFPTQKNPVKELDLGARLAVALNDQVIKGLPPEKIRAHQSSKAFPGEVPAGARRVSQSIQVDASTPGRHSTGLYAAAGDLIKVEVVSGSIPKGTLVRIGAHSDKLWHKDDYRRWPEISNTWPMTGKVTSAANAFGGLIYIEVPKRNANGTFEVRISNGVEAPYFVHGETSVSDWENSIRSHPAPWAELECSRVILTVPSSVIRALDRPDLLMDEWVRILDQCADLSSIPRERPRPERFVPDVQISAGYMHSGYPIMTWMDQIHNFVDREKLLKEGNWGFFHELGHNHQKKEWTFAGTGEVTCNLYSLYVMEKLCGISVAQTKRTSPEGMAKQFKLYDFNSPDWNVWKSKPFLALAMYAQLQLEFGWDPFKKIFADYQKLPNAKKPKTDQERMDQWLIRFSNEVNRDLGPFFKTWGMPLTDSAVKQVKGKKVWMPANFPPRK